MTAQHTPGPWFIGSDSEDDRASLRSIDKTLVVGQHGALRKVDAQRIAQCVNAHDELVAALRAQHRAIDALMARVIALDREFLPTRSPMWPAIAQGVEALAKLGVQP